MWAGAKVKQYSSIDSAYEGEPQLIQDLTETKQHCKVLMIKDIRQVLMDESGRTIAGSRRYTAESLGKMCKWLSSGLPSVVLSLKEREGTKVPGLMEAPRDDGAVIDIVNRVAECRFEAKLQNRRLIVDVRDDTIIGILDKRYLAFSTLDAYLQTAAFVYGLPGFEGAEFHEAHVINDRIFSRWRCLPPVLAVFNDYFRERFYYGFQIVNSYSASPTYKIAPMIVRANDNSQFLFPYVPNLHGGTATISVNSKKGDPSDRLEALAERARKLLPSAEKIRDKVIEAKSIRLGLGVNSTNHQKRMTAVLKSLKVNSQGLSDEFFARVNRRVMVSNHLGSETDSYDGGSMVSWSSRSIFDLAVAISQAGHQSKAYDYDTTVAADRLACLVLMSELFR